MQRERPEHRGRRESSGESPSIHGRTILATIALLLLCVSAQAGDFTAFGRDFVRATAEPVTERVTFTVANPAVSYRLRLVNRGASGTLEPVTSAVISVNGTQVFGPSDFTGNAPLVMEKPIVLAASNELAVELRGNPGAGVTLSVIGVDADLPVITATIAPAANAAGWHRDSATVTFVCTDATTSVVSCSAPVTVTAEGVNPITGTATDAAGNTATKEIAIRIDRTPPAVTVTAPATNSATREASVLVSVNASDAGSGIAEVRCDGTAAVRNGDAFQCSVALAESGNVIRIESRDVAGNDSGAQLFVFRDTEAPQIAIERPSSGLTTNAAETEIAGTAVDNDRITSLTINGTAADIIDGRFSATVPLGDGSNSIAVAALDRAGNRADGSVSITRIVLPTVSITAPEDLDVVTSASVQVRGTVTEGATVTVNGIAASVSGGTFIANGVPLAQGRTVITATARTDAGRTAAASIHIYRDAIPPKIVIDHPAEGATVFASPISVSGMVDDIAVGTVNSAQVTVTVNGVQAVVTNRAFVARNVTLQPGANSITVTARDQGGNLANATRSVTYDVSARPKIAIVSGNDQRGAIGARLPELLVVRLTDALGAPVPNRAVSFTVIENNGTVATDGEPARAVVVTTDASGIARAAWTLGMHSGAGNNVVEAASAGFSGIARFTAIAENGPAAMIVVDGGLNQYGAVQEPLQRPLIAAVVDAGSNRVANVPVTFRAMRGGGRFANGQDTITVTTDSDGRAWVTPILGSEPGLNVFRATIAGSATAATFPANGRIAGVPENTRISGTVLDNTDIPVAGVTVRIDGSTLTTRTDEQGQFVLAGAPVGYVKLLIDGSTASRPGTWPTLEFAMYTIAGQDNTLGMPIYLLPLDVRRGLFTDEVTGGTLTIPELPGFSLTVKPGSVTFPGGGRTGTISVTLVHSDKMPMPPGFGQQPRFIVTIQPVGAHFDPPAAITFPNVDGLAAGAITELYSFDHDLGQFVSIGTGSVSDDGTVIRSDPGVGIIKAGWHCGGDPAANGTTADCPDCEWCQNDVCVPNPGADPSKCCDGEKYNNATQCCVDGEIEQKYPIEDLDDCPNRVPRPGYTPPPPGGCTGVWDDPLENLDNGVAGTCGDVNQAPAFTPACMKHDTCYGTCNAGKAFCDEKMGDDLDAQCESLSFEYSCRAACFQYANLYALGLSFVPSNFFYDPKQKKACQCCP